jgi:hypothetical protein
MSKPAKYDYEELYLEYRQIAKATSLTQRAFAEQKGLHPVTLSKQFAAIKRNIQMDAFKTRNPGILLKAQAKVNAALDDPELDPKFALETYKAVADREGLSPAAVTVALQNNVAVNVSIPPIFPEDFSKELKGMLVE